MASLRSYMIRGAVDATCILIVGIPLILYKLTATPFQRGFYCDDESIRHPFKQGTVSSFVLYFVGTNLNLLFMIYFEIIHARRLMLPSRTIGRYQIHPVVWELYKVIGVFGFGCCVSQLTTDMAKYMIGRLRPHFLAVCKPDEAQMANLCQQAVAGIQYSIYVEKDICLGKQDEIREARLSFPSGHSSYSAYTMVYLVLYIQAKWPWRSFHLLKPLVQFGAILMALACAMSRISDYKHHWSDVLGGLIQGTVVAFIIFFYVSNIRQSKQAETALPLRQGPEDVRMYSSTVPNDNDTSAVTPATSGSGGRKNSMNP